VRVAGGWSATRKLDLPHGVSECEIANSLIDRGTQTTWTNSRLSGQAPANEFDPSHATPSFRVAGFTATCGIIINATVAEWSGICMLSKCCPHISPIISLKQIHFTIRIAIGNKRRAFPRCVTWWVTSWMSRSESPDAIDGGYFIDPRFGSISWCYRCRYDSLFRLTANVVWLCVPFGQHGVRICI